MIGSLIVQSSHYKNLIKHDSHSFEFSPGINFIVGPNGSGKSTIFDLLLSCDDNIKSGNASIVYDKETKLFGARMRESGLNTKIDPFDQFFLDKTMLRFKSHGESLLPMLQSIKKANPGTTFMYDEPEMALDIDNLISFKKLLIKMSKTCQFIIATHHPILLSIPKSKVFTLGKDNDYLTKINSLFKSHLPK